MTASNDPQLCSNFWSSRDPLLPKSHHSLLIDNKIDWLLLWYASIEPVAPQNRYGRRVTFQLFMIFAPPEMGIRTSSTMTPTHQTLSHGILNMTEASLVGCWLGRVQELHHEKRHGEPQKGIFVVPFPTKRVGHLNSEKAQLHHTDTRWCNSSLLYWKTTVLTSANGTTKLVVWVPFSFGARRGVLRDESAPQNVTAQYKCGPPRAGPCLETVLATGAKVYVGVLGLEIAERLTVLHHIGFRQAC
jgi:hypothetical protein